MSGSRCPLAALARIEGLHLVRSPLLWIAFALATGSALLDLEVLQPVLPGDDHVIYQQGFLFTAGAMLAGASLGLRDHLTGTADLLTVTVTPRWRLWRSRLAVAALVAVALYTTMFVIGLGFSAARGGRGWPDLRLLADGALVSVLAAWIGLGLGLLTRSRMVAILAAPLWLATGYFTSFEGASIVNALLFLPFAFLPFDYVPAALARLGPLLPPGTRSVVLGFLPDVLWARLLFVTGLVVLAGMVLLTALQWSQERRIPGARVVVIGGAALLLVGGAGSHLVSQPATMLVNGPDPSDWRPLDERYWIYAASTPGTQVLYPAAEHATTCAGTGVVEACVYPEFGARLAERWAETVEPMARLLEGLPGVPQRVRMVPVQGPACAGEEVLVAEDVARYEDPYSIVYAFAACATTDAEDANAPHLLDDHGEFPESVPLPPPAHEAARIAVSEWVMSAASGVEVDALLVTLEDVEPFPEDPDDPYSQVYRRGYEARDALRAMPPGQVRSALEPQWQRLRSGDLSVDELPGQGKS